MARAGAVDPLTREVRFSDLNLTFAAHPVTGKLTVLKNNEAVSRAIKNLILTKKFERPYSPNFGSDIHTRLFELYDFELTGVGNDVKSLTGFSIKKDIEAAVRAFEPRVEILDITVKESEDKHGLDVSIYFNVANKADTAKLEMFLERVR